MKAIVVESFGEMDVMDLREIPTPQPAKDQILVKVEAIGVNPVDTYIRSGVYPVLPELPFTPGMDAAGTVAEAGENITRFRKGDRAYLAGSLTGTYAEFVLCLENQLHHLPTRIGFTQGAAIGVPGAAAWRALFQRGKAKSLESVLIHGASGSVGLTAIQLARAAGLKVYGTAGSEKGLELIKSLGAKGAYNHQEDNYLEKLNEDTSRKGMDLILEMLSNVNLEKDLELLAPNGRVVIIGSRGRIEIDPRMTMGKETDIRGMSLFNATEMETKQIHAALKGALEGGSYTPVIAEKLPLSEAARSHRKVLESGNCGKIVLTP